MSMQELAAGFRPAVWADLPQMLALRARVLGAQTDADDHAYLSWRYRLGRPDQGGGDCWVLTRQGDLLGMVGTQEMVLRSGGLSCKALSLMDLLIQPELEGVGLGVWLNLAIQDQADAVLAIGANPHSIGLVKRLFDPLPNRRTFVHPLRFGHFLSKRLPLPGLSPVIAHGVEGLLRVARMLWLSPWRGTVQVRPLDRLDGSLAALNSKLASDPLVHSDRSPAGLTWRLQGNHHRRCDLWGAWSNGQLVGYMATRFTPLEDARRALIVVDVLVSLPDGQSALRALLWHVLEHARREGADYVAITSYRHDLERELRRAGFRQHGHQFEILGWTCKDERFRALAASRPDWTLSEIHTDRI